MKTILFDMDGTLLDMDLDFFIQEYFKRLLVLAAKAGYDPKTFQDALNYAVGSLMKNDGSSSNEELFWKVMKETMGEDIVQTIPMFENFYYNDFQDIGKMIDPNPEIVELIEGLKGKANLILATNPLFPEMAQTSRIRWAGLDPEDFMHITTYENSYHSKPNPAYFQDLLEQFELDPKDVLVVGNDALEDGAAAKLGLDVFLLENHLLRPEYADAFEVGSVQDLKKKLEGFLDER